MRKKIYTRFLGICISDEMYEVIVFLSDRRQISKSELVRSLIEEQLEIRSREEDHNNGR